MRVVDTKFNIGDRVKFKGGACEYFVHADRKGGCITLKHSKRDQTYPADPKMLELVDVIPAAPAAPAAARPEFKVGEVVLSGGLKAGDIITIAELPEKFNIQADKIMEATMSKENVVIEKVFKDSSHDLVKRLLAEFADEIPNTFQAEIDVERDKKLYVAELKRREKARKDAEKSGFKNCISA